MTEQRYGSDIVVETLQRLDIEFAAVNPGASFRGLHDSLVHAGNPELITTLFEGVAVAIAHGYAKAAQRPMAVVLHNLVGLQHGSMGIFNAWADQVPMLILGGSGPADPATRRPWLDWIHSVRWQGLTVREHTKWDDEPTSVAALPASLQRAHQIATTCPYGPTYVAVDAALQEARAPAIALDGIHPKAGPRVTAPNADLEQVADALVSAGAPVIVADHTGRSRAAYEALIEIAEAAGVPVVDLGARHNFPNTHWADRTRDRADLLSDADVVLVLDARDVTFAISELDHAAHSYRRLVRRDARVFAVGLNWLQPSGYLDREGLQEPVRTLTADTAVALPDLARLVGEKAGSRAAERSRKLASSFGRPARDDVADVVEGPEISAHGLALAVWRSVRDKPWLLANGSLRGAVRRHWDLTEWNSYLGTSGGAGLGYGLGATIGAALARRDSDTLVVDIQPDGDLLYTPSALWTAAHHRLPMLIVTANNRTYGQDRMHQALMATARGRGVEQVSVGIDIDDPEIDLAAIAAAQGVEGIGPVRASEDLPAALDKGVALATQERRPVLVDVHIAR